MRRTIDSLAALDYDDKRKLLFIICDGNIISSGDDRTTPRIVLDILGVDPKLALQDLSVNYKPRPELTNSAWSCQHRPDFPIAADQGSSTYHNYWTIMQALSRLSTDIPYQTFVSKPDFYTNSPFYRGSRVTSDCELRALQVEPRGVSSRVPVTCAVNKLIRSNFL